MAGRSLIRKKVRGAYHHGDLKAALKNAALRLVGEKGPRGFSLNEASRLAGVTAGAPYRHFPDKDALLAAIATDGNELLTKEIRESVVKVKELKGKMIEAGMAYLRFSKYHSDYFTVIFNAGLDKSKYPAFARSAREAFGTIFELSARFESTPELAVQRACAAWALVHGLATLSLDGGLSIVLPEKPAFEHLRPILEQFLSRPARAARKKSQSC